MSREPDRAGARFLPGWVLHRPIAVVVAVALPLAFLGAGLGRLETDNSAEVFFAHGSDAVESYRTLRRAFGNDDAVRLVARGEGLWSEQGLTWLADLEERAEQVDGVRSARGLASRHERFGWPPSDPAAFAERVRANPLDRDLGLIAGAGDTATVLVELDPQPRAERATTLAALEALTASSLSTAPPSAIEAELAGGPVLDRALDGSSAEIVRLYFPLLVGLASLLLAATFRRFAGVWVPLTLVAAVEVATLGAMGWAGVRLNLVLAVLPPLLFVVALATAVHVLVRFRDFRQAPLDGAPLDGTAAVAATYRDKGWSVLWTGVTTLVGFTALAASPVGPVRSLGIWSGVGIAVMTVLAFTLYPALLLLASRGTRTDRASAGALPSRPFERWFQERGRLWAQIAVRRRAAILTFAAMVAVLALAGLQRLEVESNALSYLDPDHPARAGIERLEAEGIGVSTAELLIELPPAGDRFDTPQMLLALTEISSRARREEAVLGAISAGDVFTAAMAMAVGRFRPPPELVLERLQADPQGAQALAGLLADDGRTARVTVFVETAGLDRLAPVLRNLERIAREELTRLGRSSAQVSLTGKYPLLLATQGFLLGTLEMSLSLTLVLVAILFRLILGTTRMTLLAMLPNVWPVLGVLGAMGWLGVPLDVATVMVASVVLGLAVDDTIHTLGHFRRHAQRVDDSPCPHGEAVVRTLESTAPAYVLTGLILVLGFGVCAASGFAPTARFGALAAVAVTLAVLGDLFLLPALLAATPSDAVRKAARRARRQAEEG